MNHADHVELLRPGKIAPGSVWADLGSGAGAFTLALAELTGPTGVIYSVDKDGSALQQQEKAMRDHFPAIKVYYRRADFTHPLDLPPLDGVIMANSLHFHRDKDAILKMVRGYLKPGGYLLLVEYNTDHGNPWVPFPLSYPTWKTLAARIGFAEIQLLATRPSRFMGEIYSAMAR